MNIYATYPRTAKHVSFSKTFFIFSVEAKVMGGGGPKRKCSQKMSHVFSYAYKPFQETNCEILYLNNRRLVRLKVHVTKQKSLLLMGEILQFFFFFF